MGDLDFELEIRSEGGRDYRVAVLRSPAGEAHATMRFPFDELALNVRLQAIEIALLRSGGSRRRLANPEENTVLEFGRDLFDALVAGDIRSRFDVSRTEAMRQGKPLRVKLRFDTPALSALPWEFLYDSRKGEYLVLSTSTPLVRYIELPEVIEPLSVTTPLRILGMVSSPNDLPILDVTREQLRIHEATKDLEMRGLVQIHWLENATWRDLQQALRREKWHIFHFVGHGGFDSNTDEGLLALVDENGGTFHLAATELARLLGDHQPLRLAVLNACEGARGSNHDLFASTAAAVVRRGTPAVVAMQYEITDRAAIEFSRSFYEAVADGLPVDIALAEARKSVSVAINNTLEWGTPVLFMRSEDGVLFKIRRSKEVPGPLPASSPIGPAGAAAPGVVAAAAMPAPPAAGGSVEPTRPSEPSVEPVVPGQLVPPVVEPVASVEPPVEPAVITVASVGPPVAPRVMPIAVAAPPPPAALPVGRGDAVPRTVARPRRRTRLWVAAMAVAVVVAALFLVRALIPTGETAEVPVVVGLPLADATSRLESACTPSPCFDVSVTWISPGRGGPAPGVVADQTPWSGQAAKGSKIVLSVVETSAAMVTVPDLVGRPLTEARAALDKACDGPPCFAVEERPTAAPGYDGGVVCAQSLDAGTSVEKGSPIALCVSEPASSPPETQITAVDTGVDAGFESAIVMGTDGLGLIAYRANGQLIVRHCADPACSSSTQTVIDRNLDQAGRVGGTSIAIGRDTFGIIAFHDVTNGDLKVAHCRDVTCSSPTITTVDSEGNAGGSPSLVIGADGLPLIAYRYDSGSDLRVASCRDESCSSPTISTIDELNLVALGPSMAVADGRGVIAYLVERPNSPAGTLQLLLAFCRDSACTSANRKVPSAAPAGAWETSIAIDPAENPLVVYSGGIDKDLRVYHCSDPGCAEGIDTQIDKDAGSRNSVVIGADGFGLIAYFDVASLDLRVAHCGYSDCTRSSTVLVDGPGNAGDTNSITLGAMGLPLISYLERGIDGGDLKVAHCGDVTCGAP